LNATDAARKEQGIPRSLADDLRATRHQILRAHLAADYTTAYDTMLYAMVTSVFGNYRRVSPLDLSLRPATTTASRETLKDTVAERMLEALNDGLNIAWMEAKAPEDLAQMSALPERDKQALFAWCAAYALNQQLSNDTGASAVIEAIGSRLNVDVAACWRPTADTYWGRVKKDHALDMARALIDDRWADDKSGLRKAEIAKSMEQAFCDTPQEAAGLTAQAAAKTSRWLPDGMAVGDEAANQAKPNSVEVDPVSPADDADALPAFMSDAA